MSYLLFYRDLLFLKKDKILPQNGTFSKIIQLCQALQVPKQVYHRKLPGLSDPYNLAKSPLGEKDINITHCSVTILAAFFFVHQTGPASTGGKVSHPWTVSPN